MSFTESVHGIHEFMTFTDVLAIFGHNADYIVCSRRSLVAHTETTGVSMLVQITRSSGRQPRWIRTDDNAMQINDNRDKPDCLWLSVSRNLVIADVGFLFQTYAVVWLMRGGGAMWFRGYSAESGDWSDSVNRWPETPFLGHPGPREGRVGWLQNCGSDSKDARSAVGLPPLHLWEAIEWLERLSPSISQACALRFHKNENVRIGRMHVGMMNFFLGRMTQMQELVTRGLTLSLVTVPYRYYDCCLIGPLNLHQTIR